MLTTFWSRQPKRFEIAANSDRGRNLVLLKVHSAFVHEGFHRPKPLADTILATSVRMLSRPVVGLSSTIKLAPVGTDVQVRSTSHIFSEG